MGSQQQLRAVLSCPGGPRRQVAACGCRRQVSRLPCAGRPGAHTTSNTLSRPVRCAQCWRRGGRQKAARGGEERPRVRSGATRAATQAGTWRRAPVAPGAPKPVCVHCPASPGWGNLHARLVWAAGSPARGGGLRSRPHLWFLRGCRRRAGRRPARRELARPLGALSRLETTESGLSGAGRAPPVPGTRLVRELQQAHPRRMQGKQPPLPGTPTLGDAGSPERARAHTHTADEQLAGASPRAEAGVLGSRGPFPGEQNGALGCV